MSRQLHGTSRRLQPDPEVHKQQCIAQVISGNLVSPLRFIAQHDLTHGFVTKNRIDAADVVERFLSFDKRVPSPGALVGELIQRLDVRNDNLVYHFPHELTRDRELAMTCPFVRIERCADHYRIRFGHGFAAPALCTTVPYEPIALRRLDFALLHIPNTHGTKAFSGVAAANACSEYLRSSAVIVDGYDNSQLTLQYNGLQCTITIETLFCPANTVDAKQTEKGLLVIPVSSIPSSNQFLERVSLFCALEPCTSACSEHERLERKQILGEVSETIRASMEHCFGERSPSRLRSVNEYLG